MRDRWLTAQAVGALCLARFLIAFVPLRMWRASLGWSGESNPEQAENARFLAGRVERAALRLPITAKCLPQAMALSWMLRRTRIAHAVVIAVRPPAMRDGGDALHAWVETCESVILGDLPGPWHVVYCTAAKSADITVE